MQLPACDLANAAACMWFSKYSCRAHVPVIHSTTLWKMVAIVFSLSMVIAHYAQVQGQ